MPDTDDMQAKPILPRAELEKIGFRVFVIGKPAGA